MIAPRIIHVLLLREGDYWVAQALDIDIAAQGRSVPLAQKAFLQAVIAQLRLDSAHGREPFQGIPPAPTEYWETFFKHARFQQSEPTPIDAESIPAYMIQAIADDSALAT